MCYAVSDKFPYRTYDVNYTVPYRTVPICTTNCIQTDTNNMLIVQYPMQFNRPPRNISNHVQHRFAQANGGSTNTTRVHALLLSSRH